MGIDVAVARGLDIVVLDDSLRVAYGPTTLHRAALADVIRRTKPDVIAIDSPPAWGLSGKSRPIERQLQARGISIFPAPAAEFARELHRWMETGFDVFKIAGDVGYPLYTGGAPSARSAIEVFPHASAVVLRGSLAPFGVAKSVWRRAVLEAAGVDCTEMRTTDHLDAALAALTGLKFLTGDCSVVGTPGEAVLTGAGYDNLDLPSIRQHKAALIVPRLEGTPAVAEFVFGGVIAIRRGFREGDAAVRSADWDFRNRFHGKLLHGSTLGIIGMGRIGTQVARLGAAFGMKVVAWHPWSDRDLGDAALRVQSLHELLAIADVLTLHCRLEEGTVHLIDGQALARMKPDAILVNTGRGALVDEAALRDALEAGAIGGAVIDTFDGEPDLTRTPLRHTNALLSPHIAGHSPDSTEAVARFVADTATAYLAGEPLPKKYLVS